jgi:hypothetical protein
VDLFVPFILARVSDERGNPCYIRISLPRKE